MNDYHVYGLGNALVDTEYEVEDAFLKQLAIEKGFMTLIEAGTKAELTDQLNQRYKPKKHTGGGSAANTMVALAQFGGRAFYSCKVADDHEGKVYMHDLHATGVTTNLGSQVHDGITGQCLVMITPDAERTMNTFLGISQELSAAELSPQALIRSQYLYIEGYLVSSPSALHAALEAKTIARNNAVPIAVTLSDPSMVEHFREEMESVLEGGVDLLFCNRDEALIYTGTDRIEDAAVRLKETARQFVVTLGSDGSMVFDGDTLFKVEAQPTRAIDTNGAGDMFAGAFLYALTKGHDYLTATKLANQSAAKLISSFGARLSPNEHKILLVEAGLA